MNILKTDHWICEKYTLDIGKDSGDSFSDFEYFQLQKYGCEDVLNFSYVPSSQISYSLNSLSHSLTNVYLNLLMLVINFILDVINFLDLVVLTSFLKFENDILEMVLH